MDGDFDQVIAVTFWILIAPVLVMRALYIHNYKDYKWKLGVSIIDELKISNFHTVIETVEPTFLFGIEVEIDCSNPYNVQLFEDITNKIRI